MKLTKYNQKIKNWWESEEIPKHVSEISDIT